MGWAFFCKVADTFCEYLMGDQRASWPDDVVFAIIYLPAAGKCRLNSNNYGKCHLERMMGLQWWQSWLMSYFNGGRRRAWWTFWATSVVWGLACLPLNLTLCDASPSPKTNNCKSNNWNFFSADTQSHTHNHQEQGRPKIWWTAAIEKQPFAGNMNHNRTSKSLKKRE